MATLVPISIFQLLLLLLQLYSGKSDLQLNYYSESCPKAEEIIKEQVTGLYNEHGNTAVSWIRNLFHDCIVKSCDASLLLDTANGIKSEKTSSRSFGMRNFKYINTIKEALEKECPMKVSCADIVALSARDGVVLLGGPQVEMKTGRKDSKESYIAEVEDFIPNHNDSIPSVLSRFQSIGIDTEGTVALLGAHSIGRVHCTNIVHRIYPTVDPTLDPAYANYLKGRCPSPEPNPKAIEYARNDRITPMLLDNMYYKNILSHKGLLLVDQELVSDPDTYPFVTKMAADNAYFHEQFSKALLILSENNPLTEEQGEIRRDCRSFDWLCIRYKKSSFLSDGLFCMLAMMSISGRFISRILVNVFLSLIFAGSVFSATEFDFGTLTLTSLKLLGDAHWNNGSVRLTRDLTVPNSGAGRILYSKPIRFRQPGTENPASFSTFFSFSVMNLNPASIGGGLAFLISADDQTVGDAGGFLGVMDSKGVRNGVVAVEFDTLMDVEFKDINGNHVGLDLNSMVSDPVGDLETIGIDLKSGDLVNSWIDYSGSTRVINVYVSYSNSKPKDPIISAPLDLNEYVINDFMFVGLSGSTQGSTEIHNIEWWSFSASFEETPKSNSVVAPETPPPPPTSTLINPTANTANPPPPALAPAANSTTWHESKTSGKCHSQLCKEGPGTVVGVVTASAFFLAFCTLVVIWAYNKKFKRVKKSETLASDVIKMPREFSYKELKFATKGFDSNRIIGYGAFGTVYNGVLPATGDVVAVKRCSHNGQGKAEFLSELSIIGSLRHRNLLRLQGWCHEKGEILLVYDLMFNGSLDKALFESRTILSWPHRRKILLGVASALAYLHQECENQVIHRDIKTSNIMLDEGFNARLGDFGLARQTEHDKSPDATVAAGTMGYLAPEYLLTGRATEKTDVFSYGAVVLEVASGRRPIEKEVTGVGKVGVSSNLVEWVWSLHREGRLLVAADQRLGNGFDKAEMTRVLSIGLACSHPDPMARPTMRGVVQMLVGEGEIPIVPRTKPTMSFSTSHLLMTLQDSVSDLNAMITLSTSTSENSFTGGSNGGLDLV